jgi:hypothetical protein
MTASSTCLPACLILVLLNVGCSDSPTFPRSQGRGRSGPPSGELAVTVKITGDPALGPALFNISVDGKIWGVVNRNEVLKQTVDTGSHAVAFAALVPPVYCLPFLSCANLYTALLNSWCALPDVNRQSIAVPEGETRDVLFVVDCPPLVGQGVITLTAVTTGTVVPGEFPVAIERLSNGPVFRRTVSVPSNGSVETTLPVGIHRFSINLGSTCRSTIPNAVPNTFTAVLRSGQEIRETLSVTCN